MQADTRTGSGAGAAVEVRVRFGEAKAGMPPGRAGGTWGRLTHAPRAGCPEWAGFPRGSTDWQAS